MNLHHRMTWRARHAGFARDIACRIPSALILLLTTRVLAQPILAPPPLEFQQQTPALRPARPHPADTSAPPAASPSQGPLPLQWGPVQFHPHLLYRFSYGDGIGSSPGRDSTTAIQELSPGLLFQLGSHWTLDYTPTLRFYSSRRFRDTVDHAVLFGGSTGYEDWSFGLSQGYSSSSQPLVETASQTDTETFSTSLNAVRQLSTKLSLELGLSQNLRYVDGGNSTNQLAGSKSWSTMDWLNCQFWPDFGAALGVGFGYDQPSAGSDMTYEQVQARIQWRPGDKVSITVNGGFENRQFLDSDEPDSLSPIYGASILYQIFESTSLSANVNRTVSPSYYQSQINESTDLNGSIRQRFFKKLNLDLTGGYRQSSYRSTGRSGVVIANPNREDDYSYFNVRLSIPFLKRGTLAAFFQASDNQSSANDYASSSRQGGFEVGYRF